jgi:hypothetical protein
MRCPSRFPFSPLRLQRAAAGEQAGRLLREDQARADQQEGRRGPGEWLDWQGRAPHRGGHAGGAAGLGGAVRAVRGIPGSPGGGGRAGVGRDDVRVEAPPGPSGVPDPAAQRRRDPGDGLRVGAHCPGPRTPHCDHRSPWGAGDAVRNGPRGGPGLAGHVHARRWQHLPPDPPGPGSSGAVCLPRDGRRQGRAPVPKALP